MEKFAFQPPVPLSRSGDSVRPAPGAGFSVEEVRLLGFHGEMLKKLRASGVDPEDVEDLYRSMNTIGGGGSSSAILIHFERGVEGVDYYSGDVVEWALDTSIVPLHIVSVFVLADSIVKKLRFNDLYTVYINAIVSIKKAVVGDCNEYSDSIKQLLQSHAEGAADFLMTFHDIHDDDRGNRKSAKMFLKSWLNDLIYTIDERVLAIVAEQRRRKTQTMLRNKTCKNGAYKPGSMSLSRRIAREVDEDDVVTN
jgi:hypothetical protein